MTLLVAVACAVWVPVRLQYAAHRRGSADYAEWQMDANWGSYLPDLDVASRFARLDRVADRSWMQQYFQAAGSGHDEYISTARGLGIEVETLRMGGGATVRNVHSGWPWA